jgi:hypothetical protein
VKPISDDQVVKLVPALVEAARADQRTADRFVPPRTGILEETAARHHQFVFGRRGVGKSTLLRKIESLGPNGHGDVIFVEGPHLQEDQWGKEIQALADLRLVHAIGNPSVQTGSYRGQRFVGFTLDLTN